MTITVFLADDHAIVRDGLRVLLETEPDIQVVGVAANGRDAITQVQALHPDVVVIDIVMPELNGIDAARQILEFHPDIQVIILSMYDTSEHIFRALRAGARGYLPKKSAGVEVIEAVRAVHAGRRYLSSEISEKMIEDYIRHRGIVEQENLLERLSSREREVLQLVVEGKSSAQIAEILYLSTNTVNTYRSRLMQKLGIDNLPSLVKFAILHGMIPPE